MNEQKGTAPLAGGAAMETLKRLLNADFGMSGLDSDAIREMQKLGRRLRYRLKKGQFPIPRGFQWAIVRRDPAKLDDCARCVQRILWASIPEGAPVIVVEW